MNHKSRKSHLFLSKNISKYFPLPSPSETCAFIFDYVLERDPKNIFYYQCDAENYTHQVLGFLLFDKREYMHGIFRSVILVSIFMLRVHLTSSRFDRQSQFLFSENSHSEELASYWLLTFNVTSFFR